MRLRALAPLAAIATLALAGCSDSSTEEQGSSPSPSTTSASAEASSTVLESSPSAVPADSASPSAGDLEADSSWGDLDAPAMQEKVEEAQGAAVELTASSPVPATVSVMDMNGSTVLEEEFTGEWSTTMTPADTEMYTVMVGSVDDLENSVSCGITVDGALIDEDGGSWNALCMQLPD